MAIIANNKKVLFDYEVLEKFKAGIVLTGQEVKSIKFGRIDLRGAFVAFKGEELFLLGANVPAYQPKNLIGEYSPTQPRKLLLTRAELNKIIGKAKQRGLTMKPLLVYTNKGKIKVEFAIVKNKKKTDKRETIRKREDEREMRRSIKGMIA